MSIRINGKCIGCNKCIEICPGNLIYKGDDNKAFIKYPKDCWGCSACLKECKFNAIELFLGEDIGGKGGYMYTNIEGNIVSWKIVTQTDEFTLDTNRLESNKY